MHQLREEIEFIDGPWDGRREQVSASLEQWHSGYLPDYYALYCRDYRITATAVNAFQFKGFIHRDRLPS